MSKANLTDANFTAVNFVAVDLGASGGRVLLGRFDGERFEFEELHRFPNGPVKVLDNLYWDALELWSEIKTGLRRVEENAPLAGIGVATWGVDFALLDASGALLGNPYHYRDPRTDGVMERVFEKVSQARLYERSGIQFMQINTLYQLYSMVLNRDPRLDCAETLLMMPDLFHYWFTGRKTGEYTIASTSQLLNARRRTWDLETLETLSLPTHVFPDLVQPGTVIGPLLKSVADEVGLSGETPVIATGSHDTASAVAAIPDLDENSVFISSGTWSLMGVETTEPVLNEKARALDVTNEGGVGGTVRLLKNVAGLWLLQESRRQWQREGREYGWAELLELAACAEPFRSFVDPGAETFLSPGDMSAAIRAACRRSGQPEPGGVGEVVRCCLESLALKYRAVLDGLEALLERRLDTLYIVGGGSQNQLLNQFTADACRRKVVAGPVEATALGNLLVQALATGHIEDVAAGRRVVAASVTRQRYEPEHGEAWERAYERFQVLFGEG